MTGRTHTIPILLLLSALSCLSSCDNLLNAAIGEIAAGKEALGYPILSFDANGGEGTMDAEREPEGRTITLPASTFTRSGYTFYGWSADTDGIVSHDDGDSYTFGTSDTVLYARWNNENATAERYFVYSVTDGKATITAYTGSDTDVIIPDILEGYPVIAFVDYLFALRYEITSVTIPASITSISPFSFLECFDLTSVTIGESVESIGNSAFHSAYSLVSVTIEATDPPELGTTVFEGVDPAMIIYVPASDDNSILNKYREEWSDYAAIILEQS